jgi:LDH2 family malate/lactate/ureidoglycolate dehydrogenase
MGVSPIACRAPGSEHSFILGMVPSVAARGKIYKARRRSERIPKDWALDAEGRQTDDPSAAVQGVMLLMGGSKDSALDIMMDVCSGVLSGPAFAGHVANPYDPSRPADVGHFLVAIKPDLFMSLDELRREYGVSLSTCPRLGEDDWNRSHLHTRRVEPKKRGRDPGSPMLKQRSKR